MPTPRQLLLDSFGLDAFLPGQEAVIGHLLDGHSAAAVFPTGGGKSLCYQLPALQLAGLTLVVSPLIALMKDQIDKLRALGIAAAQLDSSLTREAHVALMDDLREGRLRLLYVAPERFNNERFRQAIAGIPIAMMAVDEAHCISEWGHNFRPDYLKLAGYARETGAERVLALTATATPRVLDDICRGFDIAAAHAVRTPFFRSNLGLRFTPVTAAARPQLLLERLRDSRPGATIVYVTLQRTAEEVAASLSAAGLPARAYHAGMQTEERTAVQDWFMRSPHAIVAATIAFGMGIDKRDIRKVLHYNLSKSLESYAQEIGRAGRDGLESECESFLCPDDLCTLENFAFGDTPDRRAIQSLVDDLFARDETFDVSRQSLSQTHDIRPLVLSTLLTYLELAGYLEGGTPFYASYRFQPLAPSAEILAAYEGEPREFLAALFRRSTRARKWFDLDVDAGAVALGQPRSRIVGALERLHDGGWFIVEAAGVRNRYRIIRRPEDPEALVGELHERALAREQSEIRRLQQVLELAGANGCQASHLGQHFGEPPLERPCGTCSFCATGASTRLPARADPHIPDDLGSQIADLSLAHPVLSDPRALTRFLCGLTSPQLSRAKQGKRKLIAHPLYGKLSRVPFARVLEEVSATLA